MNKDQALDKLLERIARPREQPHAHDDCLDAEMLAAWSDGALTTAERATAEAHAAGCDRCLAVLGAMARTAPPLSATGRSGWLSIRWMVPLGAAAVALIALVVVQRTPSQSVPMTPPPAAVAVEEPRAETPAAKRDRDAAPQAATDALQDKASSRDKAEEKSKEQLQARSANESLRKDSAVPPAKASAPAAAAATPESDTAARFELRRDGETVGIIRSPQSSMQWRIDGPLVKRSTDGGATWLAQATGTTVDLLAGSSPSPAVCWIVGRSGTVLLSTDGTTWRRLTFPEQTLDIVGVAAADHLTATVTTANGIVFRTGDAGRTWTR